MQVLVESFTDATPLLENPGALRHAAEEEGVLFFRGLLPRELVLELRSQFLDVLARHGWVEPGNLDGVANHEAIAAEDPAAMVASGVGIHNKAYADIQKLELFHNLAHHPKLISLYEGLFQGSVLPHPRHIARLMLPAAFNAPTPPHQDFIHIQGTKNVWTAWIPVGDCPRELGGLTVVRKGHKEGLLPVAASEGAGGLETHMCARNYTWLETDFQAGDVLTFNSLTVHKSLKPQRRDHVRLSMDYRFQPAAEEIEQASLKPHGEVTTWDEIYRDWKSNDLKYYWKKHNLSMGEWDDSIRWQKEKIC
ncbi:MAG: phytanoyl-CoA dioxygenase family protein [Candidatus Sumerlaeia bacterium]|nr:phytanoyl-CoA dioxygenase family protein [Candidatus Sumerlaeia bacterium]